MLFKRLQNSSGLTSIMIVTVISALSTILFFSVMDLYRIGQENRRRNLDRLILNEGATSAFAVMEAALSRRLWKPPAGRDCKQVSEITATGASDGVSWKVTANYRPVTKSYDLVTEASYKGMKTVFIRSIKTLDVSDYMTYSESTDPVYINQTYNLDVPTGMIARDRRIYTKGPLIFYSYVARYDQGDVYNAPTTKWPGEWGSIVQGDRMQFLGGIYYSPTGVMTPNNVPGNRNLPALLAPFASNSPSHYAQGGGAGIGVILKDANLAEGLWNQVRTQDTNPARRIQAAPNVYPAALFGGSTPPLLAWNGVDGSGYFNDPFRMPVFIYGYAGANSFGIAFNASCMSKATAFADKKYCSHSEHFPRSFDLWRKNAGLEGALYTADAEAVPAPKITQEHMSAFEEDARQCGLVIENPLPTTYQDCPIWEKNFTTKYGTAGTADCQQVSVLDLDSVSWPTFSSALVQDSVDRGETLKRIIYSKVPLEIRQSNPRGVMAGRLGSNALRAGFSLWVINEDSTVLRGLQPDATSPLTVDPGRLREIYFNRDTTGSGLSGLKLTILTPEVVQLVSPQYQPLTTSLLSQTYPFISGKIKPVRHNTTDYTRYESDGFLYGYRRYLIDDVSLITNKIGNQYGPFFLKGLWSGLDSSAEQAIANLCMASDPSADLEPAPGNYRIYQSYIPSYAGVGNSALPAPSSNFYGSIPMTPYRYYPRVFEVQRINGAPNRQESEVGFKGLLLKLDFQYDPAQGGRDFSKMKYVPLYRRQNVVTFDLSEKSFDYPVTSYYESRPWRTPCVPGQPMWQSNVGVSAPASETALQPDLNNGHYIFTHISPAPSYRELGSVTGIEMPIIETRVK